VASRRRISLLAADQAIVVVVSGPPFVTVSSLVSGTGVAGVVIVVVVLVGAGERQVGGGQHRQGGVRVPGPVGAGLIVVQPGLVLRGLERLPDAPPRSATRTSVVIVMPPGPAHRYDVDFKFCPWGVQSAACQQPAGSPTGSRPTWAQGVVPVLAAAGHRVQ
jgi:hypothetical protein